MRPGTPPPQRHQRTRAEAVGDGLDDAPPKHLRPRYDRRRLGVLVVGALVLVGLVAGGGLALGYSFNEAGDDAALSGSPTDDAADAAVADEGEGERDGDEVADAAASPESGFEQEGLLTFRGSPGRNYYGQGPVPQAPTVQWSYPDDGAMCGMSTVGAETREWCGTGWTGQPLVFERDGRTWVVFGSYDHNIYFLDFHTGEHILPPFPTGDLVKGTQTVDPDGFPLLYAGSRDDHLRVIALDRPEAEELWSLHAHDVSPTMWNTDWDGAALVIDDYMYVGGENSQFHIVRLNRSYDDEGLVQVDPELVFNAPGWDEQLLEDLSASSAESPTNVSIENSVAYHDDMVYFANSGGLLQGWDVSGLDDGVEPTREFRFWTGDDTDATVTVDDEGMLYVAVEYKRSLPRADELGQVLKLDPTQPDDPLVWSFHDPATDVPRGFWATPALHDDIVIVASNAGVGYALDRETGEQRWEVTLGHQTWASPVVVDDVWVQASCNEAVTGYDVSDTSTAPPELWSVTLGGCIEATPAVWDGQIFVGTRAGRFYALGDD